MLDPPELVGADEVAHQPAHGVEPELEVAQRDRAGGVGFLGQLARFVGVHRERLVAQHRFARAERGAHVLRVHERRRVHAHEVDIEAFDRARDGLLVTR